MGLGQVSQALMSRLPTAFDASMLTFINKQIYPALASLRDLWNAMAMTADAKGGLLVVADVDWFGTSNAFHFNSTNGRWYQDAGLTIESDDDTGYFQQAIDYVSSIGGGGVHFGGVRYFKTPPGGQRQFLTLRSNVCIFGDGASSIAFVAPGQNTAAAGGYSGVFGSGDFNALASGRFLNPTDSKYYLDAAFTQSASIDNVTLQDFVVDGNSDFNQFSPTRGAITHAMNSACAILQGSNNTYLNITAKNMSGVFCFNHGTYGFPEANTNNRYINCHVLHAGDDPQAGDTSFFAGGCHDYQVIACSVDATNNKAWPAGGQPPPVTAFEMHGVNCEFAGNQNNGCFRYLNCGGDSFRDVSGFNVYGGISNGSIEAITFYEYAGRSIFKSKFHDCIFNQVSGVSPTGEAGIDTAPASVITSNPDGNGWEDCEFYNNTFKLTTPGTAGINSVGLRLVGNCKNVSIRDNYFEGWASEAITIEAVRQGTENYTLSGKTFISAGHTRFNDWEVRFGSSGGTGPANIVPGTSYWIINSVTNVSYQISATRGGPVFDPGAAGSGTMFCQGNIMEDIYIQSNRTKNSGTVGARIKSTAIEATPSFRRVYINGNTFTDTNTSPVMTYGVSVSAPIDGTVRVTPNQVNGFTTAPYLLDTGLYAGISNLNDLPTQMASEWGVSTANAATKNTAILAALMTWITTKYGTGGTVDFGRGVFLVDPITLLGGVYLRGTGPANGFDTTVGTVLQGSGATATITATAVNYCGVLDMTVYQSGTAAPIAIAATASSSLHALLKNLGLVYNGTAACGVSLTCSGAGDIQFATIINCTMHGVDNSAGNAGVRASSSSTGVIRNLRVSGGRIESVERAFDIAQTVEALVEGVSIDHCRTGTSTGRGILLGIGAIGNQFRGMGLISTNVDKYCEFTDVTTTDNYITGYFGDMAASYFLVTAGSRNGWSGSIGTNQRDVYPYPTDFAQMCAFLNGLRLTSSTGPLFTTFAGSPENNVTAPLGSYCADTTNGEGYIKHVGSGNTGWKLVTHA